MIVIKKAYTVTQVNDYIRNMFMQDFMLQSLRVQGEVSNCKYHSSGHIYFTLKDKDSAISCVMYKTYRKKDDFQILNGQQLIIEGFADVYGRDGIYQIKVKQYIHEGIGLLYERFEALKQKLELLGMFDASYKQALPQYVHTLGVVTAPTGAAIQDIISVAKRRNPGIQIILYPAIVQGEQAVDSIVAGIHALEKYGVDLMIVGRGGGSLEDLWAFNEEAVAQAVFDCKIPVISAVGHETDVTIIDFVADLRAITPSAAAELAVLDMQQTKERWKQLHLRMEQGMKRHQNRAEDRLEKLKLRLGYANPVTRLKEQKQQLTYYQDSLHQKMDRLLMNQKHRLAILSEQLKGLSPLTKLGQGYAYLETAEGGAVKSVHQLTCGNEIYACLKDGEVRLEVLAISEKRREELE